MRFGDRIIDPLKYGVIKYWLERNGTFILILLEKDGFTNRKNLFILVPEIIAEKGVYLKI